MISAMDAEVDVIQWLCTTVDGPGRRTGEALRDNDMKLENRLQLMNYLGAE